MLMEIKILVNIPYLPKYINAILVKLLNSPSLYEQANRLLARRGFILDRAATDRDFSRAYVENASPGPRSARCTQIQHSIGIYTSSPRSWWTLKIIFESGGIGM